MKCNCNFQRNPAFTAGVALMWAGTLTANVLEVQGAPGAAFDFLQGAGVGLVFIGLLYGSPKTRPLFHRFHTVKLRLLGRGNAE